MKAKKKILLLSMGGIIFSIIDKHVVRVAENVEKLIVQGLDYAWIAAEFPKSYVSKVTARDA